MVTNTTIYTRQLYVSLSSDTPDVDFHNGDEMYVIDTLQRIIYDEENNTWHPLPTGGGGGGPALPAVTIADNGKVLSVVDGAWAADDKRFVVTLTPTNPNYSGTMDKTVSEINEAWNAGKSIYFYFSDNLAPLSLRNDDGTITVYVVLNMNGTDIFAKVNTGDMNTEPDSKAYSIRLFQLTPMGS